MERVILVAGFFAAVALLWTRWIGPFIGRPIGKAVRSELEEVVEQIVVRVQADILHRVGVNERRILDLERHVERLEGRTELMEADQSSLTKWFRSHFSTHTHDEEAP